MKKSFISIFLILICYFGFGQYTIPQNLGSPNTLVQNPNYGGFRGGLIPYTFADTSAANSLATALKTYNGALIWTTSPPALHYRAATLNKWVQILPAGDTSGLQAWLLDGNAVTGMATEPLLGTTDSFKLNIGTNNQKRLVIPANGIVRSTSAALKYLAIDTTAGTPFGNLYYTDGGSSVNIYNSDGTLTGTRTLDGDGNSYGLTFTDLNFFVVNTDNDIALTNTTTGTSQLALGDNNAAISVGNTRGSAINFYEDSIILRPSLGNLKIDTLTNLSTQNTLIGWTNTSDADRGKVGYVTLGTGLSLSGGQLTTDGSTVQNIYNSNGTIGDAVRSVDINGNILEFLDAQYINLDAATNNGAPSSNLVIYRDSIRINPYLGHFVIDTLTNASASYVLNYNPTTGLVSYAAPSGSSQWTDTTAGIYYPDFVGIGSVMNPAYPLHIIKNSSQVRIGYDGSAYTDLNVLASGTLRISSINDAVQIFRSGGSATLQVFNPSGSDGVQLFGGTNTISSASGTGNIIISPGASEKVKIGSSSAPDSTLTVAGSAHITGYLKVDTDPLIYEILLTETGGVQSAYELKNTTGTTFTLSSSDAGVIKIDADSGTPFTANKTLVYVSMNSDSNTPPFATYSANYLHVDNTRVIINTFSDGIITANIATNMSVKIVIYP